MSNLSIEEIKKRFELSKEFNEIFDAFEDAITQRIEDMEVYKLLFWNPTLTPDELCLFGEKLAQDFPSLAYDTFMCFPRNSTVEWTQSIVYVVAAARAVGTSGAGPPRNAAAAARAAATANRARTFIVRPPTVEKAGVYSTVRGAWRG